LARSHDAFFPPRVVGVGGLHAGPVLVLAYAPLVLLLDPLVRLRRSFQPHRVGIHDAKVGVREGVP
jgi:hypothetical protein